MIWIISGPSSVGKSTFLESHRCRELTGLPADAPLIISATEKRPGSAADARFHDGSFFHYNILRPASQLWRRQAQNGITDEEIRAESTRFATEPRWCEFADDPVPKRAIVLFAEPAVILDRVKGRLMNEPRLQGQGPNDYDPRYWIELYGKLALPRIYSAWLAELQRRKIEMLLLDASDLAYREISPAALSSSLSKGN